MFFNVSSMIFCFYIMNVISSIFLSEVINPFLTTFFYLLVLDFVVGRVS